MPRPKDLYSEVDSLLDLPGAGDVGPTCELPDGRVLKRLDELRTRPYQSVFRRLRASLNFTNAQGDAIHGRAALFGWMADKVAS